SGCGKTTLMRMLAGFESPTSGEIWLDGKELTGTPPNRRPVNMMFQAYALFPHLTVADNIAFGLRRDGLPKGEVAERVEQMLALVQLHGLATRRPHQLSGGQRQRVALARSLAKRPKMLLLDEPLGALDKKLREQTQFELVNIQESLGTTFLIVTHDQDEAMTVADRIAVMDQGRLVQVAPPAQIYEYPTSRYVADFLGDVNLIEGRVAGMEEAGARLTWSEGRPDLNCPANADLKPGDTAWFGIRPEKVAIDKDMPAERPGQNAVEGTVWDIGYVGNLSTYHVKLDDGQMVRAQVANRVHLSRREISWEDRVWLSWGKDDGVLLAR
ncbi:MAG: ABC transporter ATP-binding protein, partial [Rhodospirillaceae bacterium]|nr:ABC transporter ATP-binding protein [Rhodospirillaceae bacterium]